jgi:hypothetical protein
MLQLQTQLIWTATNQKQGCGFESITKQKKHELKLNYCQHHTLRKKKDNVSTENVISELTNTKLMYVTPNDMCLEGLRQKQHSAVICLNGTLFPQV